MEVSGVRCGQTQNTYSIKNATSGKLFVGREAQLRRRLDRLLRMSYAILVGHSDSSPADRFAVYRVSSLVPSIHVTVHERMRSGNGRTLHIASPNGGFSHAEG